MAARRLREAAEGFVVGYQRFQLLLGPGAECDGRRGYFLVFPGCLAAMRAMLARSSSRRGSRGTIRLASMSASPWSMASSQWAAGDAGVRRVGLSAIGGG